MPLHFNLDLKKCSSCGACAIACMDQNDISIRAGENPFRCVFLAEDDRKNEPEEKYQFFSSACMHCSNASCITACPAGCIYKDEETNLTLFNNTNCIGCHSCAMACPFGAPAFGEDGKMQKCDGCIERVRRDMTPACVRVCPTKALTITNDEGEESVEKSLHELTEKMISNYDF